MLIKIIALLAITGLFAALVTRRIFWYLTRRDFNSRGNTPCFYQMEDPYISGIVNNLHENKKTMKELNV